jgi:hypothetical protein
MTTETKSQSKLDTKVKIDSKAKQGYLDGLPLFSAKSCSFFCVPSLHLSG